MESAKKYEMKKSLLEKKYFKKKRMYTIDQINEEKKKF